MGNTIPQIDLEQFLSEDKSARDSFVQSLGSAFSDIGFVALRGHFLTTDLIEELYRQIKIFFNLPEPVKMKYYVQGLAGQRGYTPFGKETAKGYAHADLKEFYHFGQYLTAEENQSLQYPDNVLVDELPEFNRIGKQVFKALEQTGAAVLKGIALYLDLDPNYFEEYVQQGNSILRPIHYPPLLGEPSQAVRAAAHGDINLITLLMGAQGGGLEVQNRFGEWIPANTQVGELMINMGDMMARLTNNRLKSTIHRVINPPKELWSESRYSIPFFMHPTANMPLNCLSNCVSLENPAQYRPITAGNFLKQRLTELGLVKI